MGISVILWNAAKFLWVSSFSFKKYTRFLKCLDPHMDKINFFIHEIFILPPPSLKWWETHMLENCYQGLEDRSLERDIPVALIIFATCQNSDLFPKTM